MKNVKIGVFLGYNIACSLDIWREAYKKDESNDTSPYGYDRINNENFNIEYVSLSKIEKLVFFHKYLRYAYLYFFKLPINMIKYDIIWTHYDKDALFIAKLRSIPLLGRLFCMQISCFIWLIDKSFDISIKKVEKISKLLKKIDKIIFLASTEEKIFLNKFFCNDNQLQYIPFCININAYSPIKKQVKPEVLPIDFGKYILSVGTDMHRDIDSFIELTKSMKSMKYILSTCNNNYINKRYNSNTVVLKANLQEMRWLYKNSVFVVIPLKYNEHASGCTTILEAAAMHKPVIVSDVPGIRGYIIDGVTGIVVPVGDIMAMKVAVDKLLEDNDLCYKMGEKAYEYVKDKFTTDKWAEEHIKISEYLIENLDKV